MKSDSDNKELYGRLETIEEVLFGNPRTGEDGMKKKVDEMHKLLTKASGVPWLIGMLILGAGAITAVKTFFNHQ